MLRSFKYYTEEKEGDQMLGYVNINFSVLT